MMLEAYEDLPIDSGTGGGKVLKKLDLGFDPKILIQLTKLAIMDAAQVEPILNMLAPKLKYFKREPSRSLITDICIKRDLAAISPKAQMAYDLATAGCLNQEWSNSQKQAWFAVQTIRGNPG